MAAPQTSAIAAVPHLTKTMTESLTAKTTAPMLPTHHKPTVTTTAKVMHANLFQTATATGCLIRATFLLVRAVT
jgi:hypothetical protein